MTRTQLGPTGGQPVGTDGRGKSAQRVPFRLLPTAGVVSSAQMPPPLPPLGKILCGGVILTLLLLNTGCVTGWRAKASVYDAFYKNQVGDNAGALVEIQKALQKCSCPGVPGYVVIEAYDDAALYYFLNDKPREAFMHEAVALLLAEAIETPPHMWENYLNRLLRALKASGIALEPDAIRADPHVLLSFPEVRDNPHIRHYFSGTAAKQ
jgi:hypothetical protein